MAWQIAAIWAITGIATFDFVRAEYLARRKPVAIDQVTEPPRPSADAMRRRRLRSIGF